MIWGTHSYFYQHLERISEYPDNMTTENVTMRKGLRRWKTFSRHEKQEWKRRANHVYRSENDVRRRYFNKMSHREKDMDQVWSDSFLQPLIDFMGTEEVIHFAMDKIAGQEVKIYGLDGKRTRWRVLIPYYHIPQIAYVGDKHFISLQAHRPYSEYFDPYTIHQVKGSNQFCQTFSLMHLLGILQEQEEREYSFYDYYIFTEMAIHFIEMVYQCIVRHRKWTETVGSLFTKKEIGRAIQECKKYSNICVNTVVKPQKQFSD